MRQVHEARRLREEQAQPYVVVSLETDPSAPFILNLVIKNMGTTAARNVVVDFDPPLTSSLEQDGAGRTTKEWRALTDGIPTLAPGQSMSTIIDSLFSRYAGNDLTKYPGYTQATVTYGDDRRKSRLHTYIYDLDFNMFYGGHWVAQKTIDDLVKTMDEIRKQLKSWTVPGGGIRAYTKDLDQAAQERRDQMLNRMIDRKLAELLQRRKEAAEEGSTPSDL